MFSQTDVFKKKTMHKHLLLPNFIKDVFILQKVQFYKNNIFNKVIVKHKWTSSLDFSHWKTRLSTRRHHHTWNLPVLPPSLAEAAVASHQTPEVKEWNVKNGKENRLASQPYKQPVKHNLHRIQSSKLPSAINSGPPITTTMNFSASLNTMKI
jgi:hypothetical protein